MKPLRVLFLRRFLRRTGGHVTVRDYFRHSLEHPRLQPYVYFTPDSDQTNNDLWRDIPASCFVDDLHPERYDLLFIGAWDRRFLRGADLKHPRVINVILHVRHAKRWRLRRYLRRPAYRLCNSPEVKQAIAPDANGVVEVIPNGIDTNLFFEDESADRGSILVWGNKGPEFAKKLDERLQDEGLRAKVLIESRPREEFAALLRGSRIFVPLPNRTEGFYRPALEGMACGSAVVCPDVVGNRCYSTDGENCLQPPFESLEGYLEAIRSLVAEDGLRQRLVSEGRQTSRRFSLEAHRSGYYRFLEHHIF